MAFIAILVPVLFFAIMTGLQLLAVTPTTPDYNSVAKKKALSEYFRTGSFPTSVTVINSNVTTNPLDTVSINLQQVDMLAWKKTNAEQAILSVCNQIMAKCNTSDITLLFAFMPSNTGTIASLLSGTTSSSITCGNASTYGPYGRFLLRQALSNADLTQSIGASLYSLRYNKPLSGSGCFYVDIVGT